MWKTIDSAPLDRVVDLFMQAPVNRAGFSGLRITNCYQNANGKWTSQQWDPELRRVVRAPTHWMDIPAGPSR